MVIANSKEESEPQSWKSNNPDQFSFQKMSMKSIEIRD